MSRRSKKVMAPLNKAVWASLVSANTGTADSGNAVSNSRCSSGVEPDFDPQMIIFSCGCDSGVDSRHHPLPEQEDFQGYDQRNEDVGEYTDCFGEQVETSFLPFLRQQLRGILQAVSAFECRLVQEIQRITANESAVSKDSSWQLRCVMIALRFTGFNAALCKTRWTHTHAYPAGSYEFIDVVVALHGGKQFARFLVDLDFRSQFEIARPTTEYQTLMNDLPVVFVGRPENLVKIIKLMSDSARRSLKRRELSIPPWRKYRYLHLKWLSQHKRTTGPVDILSQSLLSKPNQTNDSHHRPAVNVKICSALATAITNSQSRRSN